MFTSCLMAPAFPAGRVQEAATSKGLEFRGGMRTGDAGQTHHTSRWWLKPWTGHSSLGACVGNEEKEQGQEGEVAGWSPGQDPSGEVEGKAEKEPRRGRGPEWPQERRLQAGPCL